MEYTKSDCLPRHMLEKKIRTLQLQKALIKARGIDSIKKTINQLKMAIAAENLIDKESAVQTMKDIETQTLKALENL